MMVFGTLKGYFLAVASAKLIIRMRSRVYWAFLNELPMYHDDPDHSKGYVNEVVAGDCEAVQHAFVNTLPITGQAVGAVVAGLCISFYASWQVTLLLLGLTPLIIGAQVVQMQLLIEKVDDVEKSSILASQAVINIRTVHALNRGQRFFKDYCAMIDASIRDSIRNIVVASVSIAVSEALAQFWLFAVCLIFATWLAERREANLADVFTAIFGLLFGAQQAGAAMGMLGDVAAAKKSIRKIWCILSESDARLAIPDDASYMGRMRVLKELAAMPEYSNKTLSELIAEVISKYVSFSTQ